MSSSAAAEDRPLHHRPRALLAVGLGGAIGTALRAFLDAALGADLPLPASTLTVNLTGAFALGALLACLAARGPDEGARRDTRLLLGTGVLGGYTTYSSFAVQVARLLEAGVAQAALYAGVSLAGGVLAALAGMALGDVLARPRRAGGDGARTGPGQVPR